MRLKQEIKEILTTDNIVKKEFADFLKRVRRDIPFLTLLGMGWGIAKAGERDPVYNHFLEKIPLPYLQNSAETNLQNIAANGAGGTLMDYSQNILEHLGIVAGIYVALIIVVASGSFLYAMFTDKSSKVKRE